MSGLQAPFATFAHSFAANALAFVKRYDAAIGEYRKVLALDPSDRKAWRNMGFLLSESKREQEAIEAFREAVRLDPTDAATRFNLGFLHHRRNENDAAVEQFDAVVKLDPNLDRAWYGLGLIHLERGDLEPAITALKEAARIQYFNPHAAQHLILAYHRAGRTADALEELYRLNGFEPKAAAQSAEATGYKLQPKKA
jgi:tetratricopeptide (TPR) repeat protein